MKILLALLMVLAATTSFAVVDPDTNSMGFYFDYNADVFEMAMAPYVMVPVHVILTNPDFDSLIIYEFGYSIVGLHMVQDVHLMGAGPIDVGGGHGNHIVGLAVPLPTYQATVLATISIFLLDVSPVTFTLTGATPNSIPGSNLPAVYAQGDVAIPIGLSSGLDEAGNPQPCAYINGFGVVATEQTSWGSVKSLYR